MREAGNKILQYVTPVILAGGGDIQPAVVHKLRELGWPVVAADGGAALLRVGGVTPDLIIGDLDSLPDADHWKSVTELIKIPEQDSTDFEKCLYTVKAPLYIATGFTGSRFDHTLAGLHILHRYVDSHRVLLLAGDDVCFAQKGELTLDVEKGVRFSVYPLERTEFSASRGLQYPLQGLQMQSGELIGTSNRAESTSVYINAETGAYCVIVPVSLLDSLIDQFTN